MNLIEHYNIKSFEDICKEDLPLLESGNSHTRIRFIFKTHGIYEQMVSDHYRKDGKAIGCPKCNRKGFTRVTPTLKEKYQIEDESVIFEEDRVLLYQHNVSTHTKLRFICPIHGIYRQSVKEYYRKDKPSRCPECGRKRRAENMHKTSRSLEGGLLGHYNGSDFSMINEPYRSLFLSDKLTALSIVECTCNKHGLYYKRIGDLLGSKLSGCPTCAKQISKYGSRLESLLCETLNSQGIEAFKSVIPGTKYELDVFIPRYKVAVEVNGGYWHSDIVLDNRGNTEYSGKTYHKLKTSLCNKHGIRLLHFHYGELQYKWDICLSKIKAVCGVLNREAIYARKCSVIKLCKDQRKRCLDKWHIQGDAKGITYGLVYDGVLVSVMGWKRSIQDKVYELNRYASDPKYFIIGGFAKLEKAFVREFKPNKIISYADLRFSRGDLYFKEGFSLVKITEPDYQIIDHYGIPRHKFNYRKERFKKDPLLKYEEGLTEFELEDLNALYRVWNCGMMKFEKVIAKETEDLNLL